MAHRWFIVLLLVLSATEGCATNVYREQEITLSEHARKFQALLTREQVEAAIHENQAIELMGLRVKAGRLPGVGTATAQDLERQGALLESVREQSAVNWIALAQYFATHQRYDAARALYHRVINTSGKGGDRLYGEYAQQALDDLDVLILGRGLGEPPVMRPAVSALQAPSR